MIKQLVCLLMAVCLTTSACAAQEAPVKRTAVGFYFDTVVTLTAYAATDAPLNEALKACEGYENLLSKTVEGSDVWRINHAKGQPVTVSEHTIAILTMARTVSEWSDGAFDITVGPAVALWDFTGDGHIVPDADAVAEAAKLVDYTKVEIDGDKVTVPDGMMIDLGGIAKGYIADRVAELLLNLGVKDALISLGGNVVALGQKPGEGVWVTGIQDPQKETGVPLFAVQVTDISIVTSGIYERGFDVDGVRYHHLLDPSTGWPAQNELASATIFSQSSAMCDALSTAAFVMGLEKGMAFVNRLTNVEVIFITRDNRVYASDGAEQYLAK